jgi:hypothetical protein
MQLKMRVVNPKGKNLLRSKTALSPRLDTLNGKTVCEIWNAGFKGETVFPIVEGLLKERFPDVKIIPYTEFPLTSINSLGPEAEAETLEAVRKAVIDNKCDALITGNAA